MAHHIMKLWRHILDCGGPCVLWETVCEGNQFNKLVEVVLDSLEAVMEERMLSKLVSVLNNVSQPPNNMLVEKK